MFKSMLLAAVAVTGFALSTPNEADARVRVWVGPNGGVAVRGGAYRYGGYGYGYGYPVYGYGYSYPTYGYSYSYPAYTYPSYSYYSYPSYGYSYGYGYRPYYGGRGVVVGPRGGVVYGPRGAVRWR